MGPQFTNHSNFAKQRTFILSCLASAFLVFGCGGSGGGGGGAGGGFSPASATDAAYASINNADAVFIATTDTSVHRTNLFERIFAKLVWEVAYAAGITRRTLMQVAGSGIQAVTFTDSNGNSVSKNVEQVRALNSEFLLILFDGGQVGLVRKATGQIYYLNTYVDSSKLYFLLKNGYLYVGKESVNTIWEINLSNFSIRRVNDPLVNPVRLDDPDGGFFVADDVVDGKPIVGAYVNSGGACVSGNFCLFFDDGDYAPLGTVDANFVTGGNYSWPGRSIIYADDGNIYGWNVTTALTGANWTNAGIHLKWEFSRTPFVSGRIAKLTKTDINNMAGSNRPYPTELPARGNKWFDNGDKYFLVAQGFYHVEPVTGAAATMTYTSLDLSALWRNIGASGGGPLAPLEWTDPLTNQTKSEWNNYIHKGYVYYYKNNAIYRIQLQAGAVPQLVHTDASIYNYVLAHNSLFFMTTVGTYEMDLANLGNAPTLVTTGDLRCEQIAHF